MDYTRDLDTDRIRIRHAGGSLMLVMTWDLDLMVAEALDEMFLDAYKETKQTAAEMAIEDYCLVPAEVVRNAFGAGGVCDCPNCRQEIADGIAGANPAIENFGQSEDPVLVEGVKDEDPKWCSDIRIFYFGPKGYTLDQHLTALMFQEMSSLFSGLLIGTPDPVGSETIH
jgi:hypothetical protein